MQEPREAAPTYAASYRAAAGYYGLMLLADGISGGTASADSIYVTLLSSFVYEVLGIAAAGLAVERAGRKATSFAAFLQGGCDRGPRL